MPNVKKLNCPPIRKKKPKNVKDNLFIPPDVEKRRFTGREIYAWVQFKSGVTLQKIGLDLKIGIRQVERYVRKIEDVLKGQFDIEKYRELCFYGNIYQAIDNVGWLLAARDAQMTIAFLKGMGVFKEFVYGQDPGKKLNPEELGKKYRELSEDLGVGNGNGTTPVNRISKIAFSPDSPPEHQGGET